MMLKCCLGISILSIQHTRFHISTLFLPSRGLARFRDVLLLLLLIYEHTVWKEAKLTVEL